MSTLLNFNDQLESPAEVNHEAFQAEIEQGVYTNKNEI